MIVSLIPILPILNDGSTTKAATKNKSNDQRTGKESGDENQEGYMD